MPKITNQQIIDYCKSKPGTVHEYKTGWEADVFKVGEKMFGFSGEDKMGERIINLKNEPRANFELREKYGPRIVVPGYYSNKDHWSSWYWARPELKWELLKEQIDRSYELIVENLPRSKKPPIEK